MTETMGLLDKPFFDLLSQINSLFGYFMRIAWAIAGLLLTINLGLFWIKFAITHQGFKEELIKTTSACLLFFIIISSYPAIITGLNKLVYNMAMGSTYTAHVDSMIDKTRDDSEFWAKKGDKSDASYSTIIGTFEEKSAEGEVRDHYILDLALGETGYFSPNAIMSLIGLIIENIWNRVNNMEKNMFGLPSDLFGAFLMLISCLAVLLCGMLGAAQYFIAALEFSFISAVGVIVLPGMMWNGTKFMTEKLFGAIFGFFLKMLFVSIALMLMFTGFLAMAKMEFDGSLDQFLYMVFSSLIYMMICQSGPQLAISMLSGTPQMSLGEAMAAGAAFAGAGILGAKGAQKATQAAVVHGAGFVAQTAGAMKNGATKAYSAAGGGGKGLAAGVAGAVGGAVGSVAKSSVATTKSVAHSVLHGGSKGKGSTYNGTSRGNPYSSTEKFHDKGAIVYLKDRFSEGNKMFEGEAKKNPLDSIQETPKEQQDASSNSTGQQALPPGNTPNKLAPPERLALPAPESSTPSRLALPAPSSSSPSSSSPSSSSPSSSSPSSSSSSSSSASS